MSQLMIEFDPNLGVWSPFVYWFIVVSTLSCGVFMLVVIVGGVFDLRFLFKALGEEVSDDHDDGRVESPPGEGPTSGA
jgi:hypothetical protein